MFVALLIASLYNIISCVYFISDIFLTVGCANGDVYLLLVGIIDADVNYADIQPHPIIDGNDGVPVITMAWGRGFPVCLSVCCV